MKNIKWIAAPLLALAIAGEASALGAVSRACRFSTIPTSLQIPAANLFIQLGGENHWLPYDSFAANRYWVNESLTTDYFSVRFYLFAHAVVTGFTGPYHFYPNQWSAFHTYSSPGWRADHVNDAIKTNDTLRIFFANRGIFYSARAGYYKVGHYADPLYWQSYKVVGSHYYYDPVSRVQGAMRATQATDCNLQNWGAGTGLFDR